LKKLTQEIHQYLKMQAGLLCINAILEMRHGLTEKEYYDKEYEQFISIQWDFPRLSTVVNMDIVHLLDNRYLNNNRYYVFWHNITIYTTKPHKTIQGMEVAVPIETASRLVWFLKKCPMLLRVDTGVIHKPALGYGPPTLLGETYEFRGLIDF
jgi:hypothetical protein